MVDFKISVDDLILSASYLFKNLDGEMWPWFYTSWWFSGKGPA